MIPTEIARGGSRNGARHMWLNRVSRSRHQVSLVYGIDDLRFETVYWYEDVDLFGVEGRSHFINTYFHRPSQSGCDRQEERR